MPCVLPAVLGNNPHPTPISPLAIFSTSMSQGAAASATATMPYPAWLMGPYGLAMPDTTTPEGSSSSTPKQGVHNFNVAIHNELASPTDDAADAVVYRPLWQHQQAQSMRLATCCRTRPLPGTPDSAPDATFAHAAWPDPECTIYTRTRLQVAAERGCRFDRLRSFFEDGTGYEQFGVIVVPTASPPARVREDLPIFTRTRARTRRAAVPRSFPTCPSPAKRQRRA